MKIIIDTKENCAKLAAQEYKKLLNDKPDCILGLATGSTPEDLYKELIALVNAGEISFKQVKSYNLDEYVGLTGEHPQSYRYFMDDKLFNHVDIDKNNTHVPNGIDIDDEKAAQYDKEIEAAGGIDLQLLGVGNNGHIAFNEPGSALDSVTHVVKLTQSTLEANKRFFDSIEDVPTHAVCMGIKTIMNARKIILMAYGKSKASAMAAAIKGKIDLNVPASILQLHPDCTIYMDEEAASEL